MYTALWDTPAYSFEEAFGARDITTEAMKDARALWYRLYYGETDEGNPHMRLPYTIVDKLQRAIFSEYTMAYTGKNRTMKQTLENYDKVRREVTARALIGGECLVKPVPGKDGSFSFLPIRRTNYAVFARSPEGRPIDVGMAEVSTYGRYFYTLLERRRLEDGKVTIENKLYQSYERGALGRRVALDTLPRYEGLDDTITFGVPFDTLGLVYIKTPMANCVDRSPDGISVYAAATDLIRSIDENERQIDAEFENGRSRIIVSADMVEVDRDGRKHRLADDVYTAVDEDIQDVGIKEFAPQLREQSYFARKQEYLRAVENVIGLKKGILSSVEEREKTATEITSSSGDYNLTVIALQQMYRESVKEARKVSRAIGTAYRMEGREEPKPEEISQDFGDGVLFNRDKQWAELRDMVAGGLLQPEIALGWYFDMPATTDAERAKIRQQYMPALARERPPEER